MRAGVATTLGATYANNQACRFHELGDADERPQAVDELASVRGLRAVATFEAMKGVIVLLLGLGILGLLHKDVETAAESLLTHLHINPDRRLSHAFINADTADLWVIFSASIVYVGVRFTEAWGLWNRRVWAEWFAIAFRRAISAVRDH